MNWIKAKDRLPEKGQRVLIAIPHRYINNEWEFHIVMSHLREWSGSDWWVAEGNNSYTTPEYWMPLPDAPEFSPEEKAQGHKNALMAKERTVQLAKNELERAEKELKEVAEKK